MIITGALLAESASVVDNKLNVTGGVVSKCRAGQERICNPMLVVLLSSEPGETSATIDLTVTGPAGGPQHAQVPVAEASLGGEVGFMLLPLALAVPVDGRYLISVGAAGGSIELPLEVMG